MIVNDLDHFIQVPPNTLNRVDQIPVNHEVLEVGMQLVDLHASQGVGGNVALFRVIMEHEGNGASHVA